LATVRGQQVIGAKPIHRCAPGRVETWISNPRDLTGSG
jgi:hypothetical protein